MARILLTGGRVIDPASGRDERADVAIDGDRIAAIGQDLSRGTADQTLEVKDLLVVPGLIDPHVHLREPGQEHKEDLSSGAAAAIAGGFTTVCCMPNTSPALDSPELLRSLAARAAETGLCRIFVVAAATVGRKGEQLAELELLYRAGAVGFSDDGDCIASAGVMARVLSAVQSLGRHRRDTGGGKSAFSGPSFMQHCQEPTLTRNASMHAGVLSTRMGLTGWPRVAEEVIIERDIRLNRTIGCPYHIQHMSSGGSVEIVRRARAEGQPVTAEASPHHLLLTCDACVVDGQLRTNAKMNPPLREATDVQALRDGVTDGTITVLATDHAPHAPHEKALPFEEAPFGIVGLETALALYVEALEPVIGWPRLIELMTVGPAQLTGLDQQGLGRLAGGGPADITVIDPDLAWTISADAFCSKSHNTPFDGRPVRGRATMTIVGGKVHQAGHPLHSA